ncbi:MAG: hypothetical protein LBC88_00910 [Spirochaetaceae bacterium]|jgi:hypothetical protein|nr:hypothetical protein [Spirochaetaceae bacterium]
MNKRAARGVIIILILCFPFSPLHAERIFSEAWGFSIDFPESFAYLDGDGERRFSFSSGDGVSLNLAVYPAGRYAGAGEAAADTLRRLGASGPDAAGDISGFDYYGLDAAIFSLAFTPPDTAGSGEAVSGWALVIALEPPRGEADADGTCFLLALAYGNARDNSLHPLYFSALDSIAPRAEDILRPGPVSVFAWPRGEAREITVAGTPVRAAVHSLDGEGAAALVEREYGVLVRHAETPFWREAWARFYRIIFRDAYSRLEAVAEALIAAWKTGNGGVPPAALAWVQGFFYERDPSGTDFVDPVNAVLSGRGDCDSRALLWALVLWHADIPAAIMVSREYSHAMGLVQMEGNGARFDFGGTRWLVAETTAPVSLGEINAAVADPAGWIGIALMPQGSAD